jgi:ADP-ribose pyrophosphatase YjhB (NUDIX family)
MDVEARTTREVTRVAAHTVCADARGRVLLVHDPDSATWWLPGGGVDFGEDPARAAVRELAEETGLDGELTDLLSVRSAVEPDPHDAVVRRHNIRVIYAARVIGGRLRSEPDGSTDAAAWFTREEAGGLALAPFTRDQLNL